MCCERSIQMKKLEKSVRSHLWPYAHDLQKRWVLQGFTGQAPCWGYQTLRCAYADIDVEHGVCAGISIYGMGDAIRRDHYEHTIDFVDISIIAIHNAYCDATNNMDDWVYSMDEFDEIMADQSPWEIARCAFYGKIYGKFCPADDYFWFNGYANLESSDFAPDVICIEDIAKYIDNNEDDLGSDDIYELLEAA